MFFKIWLNDSKKTHGSLNNTFRAPQYKKYIVFLTWIHCKIRGSGTKLFLYNKHMDVRRPQILRRLSKKIILVFTSYFNSFSLDGG